MPQLPLPLATLLSGTRIFLPCSWFHVEGDAKWDTTHITLPLNCWSPREEWINQVGDLGKKNWASIAHSLTLIFGSHKMCPQNVPSIALRYSWSRIAKGQSLPPPDPLRDSVQPWVQCLSLLVYRFKSCCQASALSMIMFCFSFTGLTFALFF